MRHAYFNYRLLSYVTTTAFIGTLIICVILFRCTFEQYEKILELNSKVIQLEGKLDIDEIHKKAEIKQLSLIELYERLPVNNDSVR